MFSVLLCQFSMSLEESVVPDDWKKANITPIFKSESRMSVSNYRPVSLTCIICKIMEAIIRDNMISHLTKYKLIHSTQHGFMAEKSCQTNLIEYLDTLTRLVNEGHNVDVIYLDFAKAFDKVSHLRLLQKLEAHGISGKVLSWVGNWLSNRLQRVVLNGFTSDWSPVSSGVPQGSVLGPICFVIFINNLDEVLTIIDGFVSKFADDTKYLRIIHNDEDHMKMQSDIDKLLKWAETWHMEFNSKKCKIIHFGRTNPQYSYCMGGYAPAGTILQNVNEEKDLGVIITNSLKPSSQCAKAAMKANGILGQMWRSFHYRDKSVWIWVYKTYVQPHLEFAVQAWSPWYSKDIQLLEKVQKRAVNMVVGLKSSTYEGKLKEINLTLEERRLRGDMIQVWKYMHDKNCGKDGLFRMANEQHGRSTRHTSKAFNIYRTDARLDVRKNFFTVKCIDKWNHLPEYA